MAVLKPGADSAVSRDTLSPSPRDLFSFAVLLPEKCGGTASGSPPMTSSTEQLGRDLAGRFCGPPSEQPTCNLSRH